MKELVTGHEPLLSYREILDLYNNAHDFLSTPLGNKTLREMDVMEAVLHGQGGCVDNECTYSADDYNTNPDLFAIQGFGTALFLVNEGRLFSTQNPLDRWSNLENEVKVAIPDFKERFLTDLEEFRPITGYVAEVKNHPFKLFHKMWNNPFKEESSLSLLQRGWLPIQFFVKAFVVTTDNQRHKAPHGFIAFLDFIEEFENSGTLKTTEWEISSFKISLPDKLD